MPYQTRILKNVFLLLKLLLSRLGFIDSAEVYVYCPIKNVCLSYADMDVTTRFQRWYVTSLNFIQSVFRAFEELVHKI